MVFAFLCLAQDAIAMPLDRILGLKWEVVGDRLDCASAVPSISYRSFLSIQSDLFVVKAHFRSKNRGRDRIQLIRSCGNGGCIYKSHSARENRVQGRPSTELGFVSLYLYKQPVGLEFRA